MNYEEDEVHHKYCFVFVFHGHSIGISANTLREAREELNQILIQWSYKGKALDVDPFSIEPEIY